MRSWASIITEAVKEGNETRVVAHNELVLLGMKPSAACGRSDILSVISASLEFIASLERLASEVLSLASFLIDTGSIP